MAGGEKLLNYGELLTIDNIVRLYPGTYTHDEVFNLNCHFVYQLMAMNKQRNYVETQSQKMRRKSKLK